MRRAAPLLVLVLVAAGPGSGCVSTAGGGVPPERHPIAPSGAATAGSVYDLPPMRVAHEHRARGSEALEIAYGKQRDLERRWYFDEALREYREAENAYYEAMATADERYHPVIEREIDQVESYVRMIQKDRPPDPLHPPVGRDR